MQNVSMIFKSDFNYYQSVAHLLLSLFWDFCTPISSGGTFYSVVRVRRLTKIKLSPKLKKIN